MQPMPQIPMPQIRESQGAEPAAFPRVLIVAEHASTRFGGEAILPYHWFRLLRARGVPVWMVVHDRCRSELEQLLPPADLARVRFVADSPVQVWLWRWCGRWPERLRTCTIAMVSALITQQRQRQIVLDLVRREGIEVVHEPIPVSPRAPSMLYGVGAPVVMGPMNGGMSYPPAFRGREGRLSSLIVALGRAACDLAHRLIPGKLRAATLLTANRRTRDALPAGVTGEVRELVENGVDLGHWRLRKRPPSSPDAPVRFGFAGRLVDWKGVDLLLEAFARVAARVPARLEVIGNGPMRGDLEAKVTQLALADKVTFAGWLPQAECRDRLAGLDVFVLPSLLECGGAAVLEAMAVGLPVIATDWGGPADYLDPSCGILVPPDGREGFVAGLAAAMHELALSPERRRAMGRAARERVQRDFDWQAKVDRMLELYRDTVTGAGPTLRDPGHRPPDAGATRLSTRRSRPALGFAPMRRHARVNGRQRRAIP